MAGIKSKEDFTKAVKETVDADLKSVKEEVESVRNELSTVKDGIKGEIEKGFASGFAVHTQKDPEYAQGEMFEKALPLMLKAAKDRSGRRGFEEYMKNGVTYEGGNHYKVDEHIVQKTTEAGSAVSAGNLIPLPLAQDVIPVLFSKSFLSAVGAQIIEMPNGQLDLPKGTGSTTAVWGAESTAVAESDIATGILQLRAKKLTILSDVSNDFIRRGPRGGEAYLMRNMMNVVGKELDQKALAGDGTSNTPTGIYNLVDSGQIFAPAAKTAAGYKDALIKAMRLVGSDVPGDKVFVMSDRSFYGLVALRDSEGWVFPGLQDFERPTLFGKQVVVTNNIPDNRDDSGATTGDESRIYFGAPSALQVGYTLRMDLEIDQPRFKDDVSTYRMLTEVDFGLDHDDSWAVINELDELGA